jgi:hypothetical protein
LFAFFEDTKKAPADATPKPPTPPVAGDDKTPKIQLRSIRAEGNVSVVRGTEELTAPRLTYDPITHWMRAIGMQNQPAVFTTAGGGDSISAKEFLWNTETWKMKVIDAYGGGTSRKQ